jgi:hypothetical protein
MNLRCFGILCACIAFCSTCPASKNSGGVVRLDTLGVSLQIPANFRPVPEDQFTGMEKAGATVLPIALFTAIAQYGYADDSGPRRFFMIDLYVINSQVTAEDAAGFQNMFYSIGLL